MDVDTIVAVSTPPGRGGIGVVRLSGPDARTVLAALARGMEGPPPARRATLAELRDPATGERIDRAVVTLFEGPASFTGEDVVEMACHGSPLITALLTEACRRAGARVAEAGEFTRRAYLNGKLDLLQAEATADLIHARSAAAHRAALGQLDRGLSQRVSELRQAIVRLEALLVHHIDFPEEDDAPVPLDVVVAEADVVAGHMSALLATAPGGTLLHDGALVVLAGRPNAGKSSLYNALLGTERAIVTEEAGTTRDALEVGVSIGDYPFRLVDTAGLRETEALVERLGIEVARRYVDGADLVVLCVPADEPESAADQAFLDRLGGRQILPVVTKADRVPCGEARDVGARSWMRVSAVTGEGLDALGAELVRLAYGEVALAARDEPVVTRKRHVRALEIAKTEVESFREGLTSGLRAEVAATHLRVAETALEELLGIVSVDDVLDRVFRDFCVGK